MAQLKGNFTFLGWEKIGKKDTVAVTVADLDDGGRQNWSLSAKGDEVLKAVKEMVRGEKYLLDMIVRPEAFNGREYLSLLSLKPPVLQGSSSAASVVRKAAGVS